MDDKKPQNNNLLTTYLSFAWQLIAGIALFIYIGIQADKWIKTKTPLLVWILPLLVIIAMMIKVIRDTTNKKND
jgi:F0F1-type ATP synthase assembly protein I